MFVPLLLLLNLLLQLFDFFGQVGLGFGYVAVEQHELLGLIVSAFEEHEFFVFEG